MIRPFDRAQIFTRVFVLIGFIEESLLGDEELQSARPEKRVKMALTSGITVGSR